MIDVAIDIGIDAVGSIKKRIELRCCAGVPTLAPKLDWSLFCRFFVP
jgi:hypothetical protein